jgi:hypothetical protein
MASIKILGMGPIDDLVDFWIFEVNPTSALCEL